MVKRRSTPRWQRARMSTPGLPGPQEMWVETGAPWVGNGFAFDRNESVVEEPSFVTHFVTPDGGDCYVCAADIELLPVFANEVEREVMPGLMRSRRRNRRRPRRK